MTTTSLVEDWEEDMKLSSPNSDFDDESNFLGPSNGDLYFHHLIKEQNRYLNNNLAENAKSCSSSLDFEYIHDQDMNYYQENYTYYNGNGNRSDNGIDDRPMLQLDNVPTENDDGAEYDEAFDEEVNKLLDDLNDDFLLNEDSDSPDLGNDPDKKKLSKYDNEQYEDYCDDFIDEEEDENNTPEWFDLQIKAKVREMKYRLNDLSKYICNLNPSMRNHIIRTEQDHNTPLCKIDLPRYPPLSKPWVNYWRFNCSTKCNLESSEPQHIHSEDCLTVVLEHVGTNVTVNSKNLLSSEFPAHVMHTVELFQNFAKKTLHDTSYLETNRYSESTQQKPTWIYIKIRSNYKKEIMLVVAGKSVTTLLKPLQHYFERGPGRASYVVSLYCVNIKCFNSKSQKKGNFPPTYLVGQLKLRDKVGPITIQYDAKTSINFNAIETVQLGKIMRDYLAPTPCTTLIEIGCNIGAISLMLAKGCDKVLGFNTLDYEVKVAEEIASDNNIYNSSFLVSTPKDFQAKCLSLIKRCRSVAIVNLASPYGKTIDIMKSLRNLPTVWRVAVYGTFTKEFHKHVLELTKREDDMGDEFLPLQGCMIDKSASSSNAFDIVILFERKSLIEPDLDVITPGPTVNIKKDEIFNAHIKIEKGFGEVVNHKKPAILNITCPQKKEYFERISNSKKLQSKFDCPSLPSDKDAGPLTSYQGIPLLPSIDVPSEGARLTKQERKFDCPSPPGNSRLPSSIHASPVENFYDHSTPPSRVMYTSTHLYKKEKKFDCPSPPGFRSLSNIASSTGKGFNNTIKLEKGFNNAIKLEKGFNNAIKLEKGFNNAIKLEKGFNNPRMLETESTSSYSSKKNKRNRFDCSSLSESNTPIYPINIEKSLPPPVKVEPGFVPVPVSVTTVRLSKKERKFDCPSPLRDEVESEFVPVPPAVTNGVQLSKKERKFDCPSPPRVKVEPEFVAVTNNARLSKQEKKFDCPSPPKNNTPYNNIKPKMEPVSSRVHLYKQESKWDCPPTHKEDDFISNANISRTTKTLDSPVVIKREKQSPPPENLDCPFEQIKTEPIQPNCSPLSDDDVPARQPVLRVKNESTCDKEEGELSPESDESFKETASTPKVVIKSERMDIDISQNPTLNPSVTGSEVSVTSSSSIMIFDNVRIKSEPVDDFETVGSKNEPIRSPKMSEESMSVVKKEPGESTTSLSEMDDIENMPTPIHNPAALQNRATSPTEALKKFVLGDSEFKMDVNKTFLSDTIDYNKNDKQEESTRQQTPTIRVKPELGAIKPERNRKSITDEDDEVILLEVKTEPIKKECIDLLADDPENMDLRKLIEQRQILQKQLSNDLSLKSFSYDRSPKELPDRYRSRSPEFRRRSPLRQDRYRRNRSYRHKSRSPSLSSESKRKSRYSRSPSYQRYSPKRRTSYKRTSSSRSSVSPDRCSKKSISPRGYKRSISPRGYKRSISPRGYKRTYSPAYRDENKYRKRSTTPKYERIRSPPRRRMRGTRSRSRSHSLSLSSSPSRSTPPIRRLAHPTYNQFSDYYDKKPSISSPHRINKKDSKSGKTEEWDIPGLSVFEDSSPDKQKRVKKDKKPSRRSRSSSISKHKSKKKRHNSTDEKRKRIIKDKTIVSNESEMKVNESSTDVEKPVKANTGADK